MPRVVMRYNIFVVMMVGDIAHARHGRFTEKVF